MKEITEQEFNFLFCDNYQEKYDLIYPKTTPASTFDEVLRAICRYSQGKGKILEIGTWIGRSALAFSQNFSEVVTIDCPQKSDIKYDYLGMEPGHLIRDVPNVKLILEDSSSFDFDFYEKYFDCVYVDGNHTAVSCLIDMVNASQVCKEKGLIFVDDYFCKFFGVKEVFDAFPATSKYLIKNLNLVFFTNN
jgi:predicted O-methyltransferase YrrM